MQVQTWETLIDPFETRIIRSLVAATHKVTKCQRTMLQPTPDRSVGVRIQRSREGGLKNRQAAMTINGYKIFCSLATMETISNQTDDSEADEKFDRYVRCETHSNILSSC